jgi:peptidoglycan glycosyltransferase
MLGDPASTSGGAPRIGSALLRLALALAVVYGALGAALSFWQVVEASRLTQDPGNPLVLAAARNAPRGRILDRRGVVLAENVAGPDGEPMRLYPDISVAPVVGYKSLIFGTSGLERTYDAQLTGLSHLRPGDEVLRKFRADPYDPSELTLSIDLRLQRAAMRALREVRGAIVAIEPTTGRVVALASAPSFDPNRLVDPQGSRDYLATLREAPSSPLLNRATQGRYVPGSVFKVVTATAGIGSDSISRDTTYRDQPREYETGFLVEGFRIHDSPRDFQLDHPLDFIEATEVSSNIWFAHAGLDTGASNLLEWARRFGFDDPIDFELPTLASQVTGGGGPLDGFEDRVELANAAYGQGEVFATPLQMALVAATVANDGELMKPRLVDRLESENGIVRRFGPQSVRRVVDPLDAALIQLAMNAAVEGEFGRLFAGAAKVPGVQTAGKSGSAQVGDRGRPHSWFIGFAPVDEPRIAIAVLVERGGFGRERAVPIAGDLMEQYLGFGP